MTVVYFFRLSPRLAWLFVLLLFSAFPGTLGAAWQMKQAPLMTQWAALVDTNAPLPEYPRPQLVRADWLNLNGIWQFQPGTTNDPVPVNQTLSSAILVPYPMESAISGVMQYCPFSWYRRTFTVPPAWTGRHIILHLDAVNWQSTVYINGQNVGVHKGGYDPISYDITPYLSGGGPQELIIQVYSPVDNGGQPRGKQTLYPGGIMYTSSSGIWQPAWLEPVDASGVSDVRIIPDLDHSQVRVTVSTYATSGVTVVATVRTNGTALNSVTGAPQAELDIPIPNPNLWSPDHPFLYDLQIQTIHSGVTNDMVTSYFGMRKIATNIVNGVPQIYLNNQPYFEMGPLDQGFWSDGIYTAPTDEALKYDLVQTKALGFNMIRKHIKVERQRWYYWADKLGFLVWQDMPSCNSYTGNPSPPPVDANQFITELTRMVQTHWNSPAIMMWDIFNEAQGQQNTGGGVGQTNTAYLVQLVKSLDPSRLVNQASGGDYYGVGDVFDVHSYPPPGNPTSTSQVPVVGEYGGIGFLIYGHLWNPGQAGGGYTGAGTTNDLASIYDSWSDNIVYYKSTGLNAAVYTQITDVENECNGLLTYDRILKPSLSRINASNQKAVTASIYLSTVLPSSQNQGRVWSYTTTAPAANWYATNFDASSWSTGQAGFGTAGTPGAVVRTTWNSSDIWLRQTFVLGPLTPSVRAELAFYVYHDEDCEIYLNGVLAGSATGYATSYVIIPMNSAGQNALIANGTNLIAVHCHQTSGGQNIDAGISRKVLVMNSLVVPTDYIVYWKLDETNGTIASNSSGNGNTGAVVGPTWSTNGQVNGCLNFNGIANYVQVTNPLAGDFSVSFWVKTTQVGGSGQWYQGRGLVDGYVAGNANDFGTALLGNYFAFGTGNPDTTIVSTTPINDGVWHHCVATRAEATGALKIYVDGILQAFGTGSSNPLTAAASLRFGSRQTGVNFFSGNLDEIKFYNRALGSNEVTALYRDSAFPAPAPTNLTAMAGNSRVTLSWTSDTDGISGYDVKRSTSSGGPYTSIAILDGGTYSDNAVVNGSTYYYVVSAMNSLGDGPDSLEVSATPSLNASLKTWFQADAITGLTNGAAVSYWLDLSGNGNYAAQSNAPSQPNYVTGALNGLPVVRFNAASSNYLDFPRSVQDDFTIFCVFRSTQGHGSGSLYFQGAGLVNGEVPGSTTDFGTCLFSNGQISAGTGNPDVAVDSTPGFNDGLPHLLTFKRIESSGELDLYVDGAYMGTTTGTTSSLQAPQRLVLGAQQTLTFFLSGDIAEVKIYDSALGDSDRAVQESTLIHKWGVRAPPAPTGLGAAAGNHQILLKWNPVSTGLSYNLKRSTTPGGPYTIIANPSATNFTDATVVNGTTYYYVVSAVATIGEGNNSSEVSAKPGAPTVTAWFKADAITGLTNGAAVSFWGDSSGNGYSATQSTPSLRPTFATDVLNGLPVMHFESSTSNYLSFSRPVQDDFTILSVFRSSQGTGTGTQYYQAAGLVNGEVANTTNDFGTSLNANGQILAGTGRPDITAVSAAGYNDGLPHLMTFKRTRSTGALALYVDGALSAIATGGTQSLSTPTNLVLGAQRTLINFLTGDIAEVKIFNSALSDLDRGFEESALVCKYGLCGSGNILAAPSGLTGAPGNRLISLSWSGVSGAASYALSYSINPAGPFLPIATNLNANSYLDTNAVSGQTNYYEVTAVNGCNTSLASAPVGIFLPNPVLSVASIEGGSLSITWPAWASDWKLFNTSNLAAPTIWSLVTNSALSNSGSLMVSIPIGPGSSFFRLSSPN